MKKRSTLKYVKINDLKLDTNNPRFGELYNGSTNENDLVEYLLYEEAAEEIATAISNKNEFYEDKALWVIKDSDGKFIVRDGNRRCAAVKALRTPTKFNLSLKKLDIKQLPVYEYMDANELNSRIGEEHAASLFRSWERIAKSLQILDLAINGKDDEMNSLDSRPGDFIKLGSFYKEAVKYGGDELRKQLRRGRGKTGGKTIIYERLFRDAKLCGYKFRNSPKYTIEITDKKKFEQYITSLVKYIEINPEIKTSDIDNNIFTLKNLKDYGFDAYHNPVLPVAPTFPPAPATSPVTPESPLAKPAPGRQHNPLPTQPIASSNNFTSGTPSSSETPPINPSPILASSTTRHSIKRKPDLKRKKIPAAVKTLIDECFDINKDNFPNAKTALTRVTFECTLKYVVENTTWNSTDLLKNSAHFRNCFYDKSGVKLPYTNFTLLKNKFAELISDTGIRKAFANFDLEKPHQIIHNYHTIASPSESESICINLIPLIEFLLEDQLSLISGLDTSKL